MSKELKARYTAGGPLRCEGKYRNKVAVSLRSKGKECQACLQKLHWRIAARSSSAAGLRQVLPDVYPLLCAGRGPCACIVLYQPAAKHAALALAFGDKRSGAAPLSAL